MLPVEILATPLSPLPITSVPEPPPSLLTFTLRTINSYDADDDEGDYGDRV